MAQAQTEIGKFLFYYADNAHVQMCLRGRIILTQHLVLFKQPFIICLLKGIIKSFVPQKQDDTERKH